MDNHKPFWANNKWLPPASRVLFFLTKSKNESIIFCSWCTRAGQRNIFPLKSSEALGITLICGKLVDDASGISS